MSAHTGKSCRRDRVSPSGDLGRSLAACSFARSTGNRHTQRSIRPSSPALNRRPRQNRPSWFVSAATPGSAASATTSKGRKQASLTATYGSGRSISIPDGRCARGRPASAGSRRNRRQSPTPAKCRCGWRIAARSTWRQVEVDALDQIPMARRWFVDFVGTNLPVNDPRVRRRGTRPGRRWWIPRIDPPHTTATLAP